MQSDIFERTVTSSIESVELGEWSALGKMSEKYSEGLQLFAASNPIAKRFRETSDNVKKLFRKEFSKIALHS